MVKCNNCGITVSKDSENCPNCGNDLINSDENQSSSDNNININSDKCGAELSFNNDFYHSCGNKFENEDKNLKCRNCGSELYENVLFCPTCGSKVIFSKKIIQIKTCPNCRKEVENDVEFCPECGTNIGSDGKTNHESVPTSFENKINLEKIIKPSIIALVVSIILSLLGLFIGFSWFSFILAVILTVGFFAGIIDNEVNAIIFGLFVGLILGILEIQLVELIYGAFVARFYEGFFGEHLIILMIFGVIVAYISNMFLKETIGDIISKFKGML